MQIKALGETRTELYSTYSSGESQPATQICATERPNRLAVCDKWHESEMPRALDSDSELALLLSAQAGLCNRLDLAIDVDVATKCFDIFVVKVHWCIFLESFHHDELNFLIFAN